MMTYPKILDLLEAFNFWDAVEHRKFDLSVIRAHWALLTAQMGVYNIRLAELLSILFVLQSFDRLSLLIIHRHL